MSDFNAIEQQIRDQLSAAQCSRKLMVYALDTTCLSDEAYRSFPEYIASLQSEPLERLQQYSNITRLVWVRAFFEHAEGHDPWQVFREVFSNIPELRILSAYQLKKIAEHLPRPFNGRDDFPEECWIVSGNPDPDQAGGQTSRIWKFLASIVRRLSNELERDKIEEECQKFVNERSDVPPFFRKLIDVHDSSFYESLKALKTTQGVGWLGRIAPLMMQMNDRADCDAEWMLYYNGNMRRIDLVIDNLYIPPNGNDELSIRQGKLTIESCRVASRKKLHFSMNELVQKGVDVSSSITIALNNRKVCEVKALARVFPADQPTVFRYPLQSADCWLPMVPLNTLNPIYTRRLVVMVPGNMNANFCLGGQPIDNPTSFSLSPISRDERRLNLVSLEDANFDQPQDFSLDGQRLVTIGHRAYIAVTNVNSDVKCLDMEDVEVVFGDTVNLEMRNAPGDGDFAWEIAGGWNIPVGKTACIRNLPLGRKHVVSCRGVRVPILCLPENAFHGNAGWEWTPTQDEDERIRYAPDGFETGTLAGPNGVSLRLKKPLLKVVWWYQKGAFGVPDSLDDIKDFNDHSEMASYLLFIWVPDGQQSRVKFGPDNNLTILRNLDGGICHRIPLGQFLEQCHIVEGVGNVFDGLFVDESRVAKVLRVPRSPVLIMQDGHLRVFFPEGYNPAQYSLVCLFESGIKDGVVESSPCQNLSPGVLHTVEFKHTRSNGEGVWVALVFGENLSNSMADILLKHIEQGHVKQWYSPDNVSLSARLGVAHASADANRARGWLDTMAFVQNSTRQHGVFADAIANRKLLQYSDRPDFWKEYYSAHCRIEAVAVPRARGRRRANAPREEPQPIPIEMSLELMLRAGFNWCAEPNWLIWAYDQIPDAMGWHHLTNQRRNQMDDALSKLCPPLPAQKEIEANQFPSLGISREILSPQGAFGVRCPDGQGIYRNGIGIRDIQIGIGNVCCRLCNDGNARREIAITYHDDNVIVRTPFGHGPVKFVGYLPDGRDNDFLHFMLDGEYVGEESILQDNDRDQLKEVFDRAIVSADNVIGKPVDRGLGFMFTLASNGFADWEDKPIRADIFRAAVICRLHAWLGWRGLPGGPPPQYPQDWPLSEPANYDLVCRVIRDAWMNDTLRKLLVKDLIPVEWMLAWFHN